MKKCIALILVLMLCLAFCACGDDAGTTPTNKPEPSGTNASYNPATKPSSQPNDPVAQPTDPTDPATQPATHTHSYETAVTQPTCTQQGYTTYICACGDSYTADETAIIDHDYQETARVDATSTQEGSVTYTCTLCGGSYSEVIPVPQMPTSALAVLENIWDAWDFAGKEDLFFGGSLNNPVFGAPAAIDIVGTDELPWPLQIPVAQFNEVKTVAVLNHVFGSRSFVSSVIQVENAITCASDMIIDMLRAVRNNLGAPECLMIYLYDDEYLIVTVGGGLESYRAAIRAACPDVVRVYDGLMAENGHADGMYQGDPSCEHNYTSVVTEPTMYEDGNAIYTCSVCGDAYAMILSAGSAGLEYQTNDDGTYTVVGLGTCTDAHVIIPKYHEGARVTAIGKRAFYNCSTIEEMTIPYTIESIGTQVFYKCSALHTVYYNSVYGSEDNPFLNIANIKKVVFGGKRVPSEVCYNASNIEEVVILDSVTRINDYAFYGCSSLTNVTIGRSVASIGYDAFRGCGNLEVVNIRDIVTWCSMNFDSGISNPLYNGVALYLDGEPITELVIPDGVTRIVRGAFQNCSSLVSVKIPDGVTSIGAYVFASCTSLEYIELPDSVASIGNNAFGACISLTSIKIPHNVSAIPSELFYNCTSLTSIEIPDSVTSIGDYAFYNCSSLKKVTIPDSVSRLGAALFYNCTGLQSIVIPDSVVAVNWGPYSNSSLFYGCTSLENVIIGDGLTSIGNYTFYGCSNLQSVEIPDSVTSIGVGAFSGCSSLESIEIPDSVTSIDGSAFSGCSSLKSIEIPDSVTSIGGGVFSGCSSLTSIVIPDSVTSIGGSAFRDCSSLTSIEIPDSVTSIGEYAFYDCSSLASVEIGNNVTSIGNQAFHYCSGLKEIRFGGTMAQWEAISKGNHWNSATGNYIIYCTDGDISK